MIPTIQDGTIMIDVNTLPACPVETTLTLISDKWKILIVRDLLDGTKRFSELRRSIGNISQKVLTSNLRQMEADGLVHREVYAEVPPRVEYSLTDTGRSLKTVIDALWNWGEGYKAALTA
ncbi:MULTISPECIES: helix-turn-helix domain-containing protein [Bifidobacterium]|uniref:Transcriptional regulator n=1 Tax=Bifidobacterium myosotis TaxID=1630166 RepID=A0A261FJ81_9BIFI|nr:MULTISPECIES: helix-turn-helix domain-containing protein [Bifidobacterium]KAA8828603.1 transcriptional regulator [Bifidobacterium myosotis]OZG59224.1 MarR family transcriptional regulator [Bifidobacterium myosotis]TPF95675.1 MarR family transcriptional regulator [Bifidobacterium sp. UTBIF-78]